MEQVTVILMLDNVFFFCRTTFVNLEMNGKELRRLALHMFSEKEVEEEESPGTL